MKQAQTPPLYTNTRKSSTLEYCLADFQSKYFNEISILGESGYYDSVCNFSKLYLVCVMLNCKGPVRTLAVKNHCSRNRNLRWDLDTKCPKMD